MSSLHLPCSVSVYLGLDVSALRSRSWYSLLHPQDLSHASAQHCSLCKHQFSDTTQPPHNYTVSTYTRCLMLFFPLCSPTVREGGEGRSEMVVRVESADQSWVWLYMVLQLEAGDSPISSNNYILRY